MRPALLIVAHLRLHQVTPTQPRLSLVHHLPGLRQVAQHHRQLGGPESLAGQLAQVRIHMLAAAALIQNSNVTTKDGRSTCAEGRA